ncbi:MAG: YicC family protein [Clostridia bacterium]|nr:YicC family protein [Clostridia bacterium]
MIKSMTGYGRHEYMDEAKKIVIDIKSVNQRFCDVNVKMPRAYGYLEDKVKEYVSSSISRGKVDVFVYIENYSSENKLITLDKALCDNYYSVISQIKEEYDIKDDITLSNLLRFQDIFVVRQEEEDKDAAWEMIKNVLARATEDFINARIREGERMLADLKEKGENIKNLVLKVEERAPKIVEEYAEKLKQRMTELLGDVNIDEGRLLTEVGIMADRVCIAEELVRLKSHLKELDKILALDEPVGRKLDFLVQEINREINTIGSKSNDIDAARLVVDMKSEVEKMREQIQNIE